MFWFSCCGIATYRSSLTVRCPSTDIFCSWDDWVLADRVRKWTDENRELATQLKKEHQQATKALNKSTAKSRRGQGSEIGSGRGSEERTSSVPAAGGRGSKRVRDNDIEKVSEDIPSHKSTL